MSITSSTRMTCCVNAICIPPVQLRRPASVRWGWEKRDTPILAWISLYPHPDRTWDRTLGIRGVYLPQKDHWTRDWEIPPPPGERKNKLKTLIPLVPRTQATITPNPTLSIAGEGINRWYFWFVLPLGILGNLFSFAVSGAALLVIHNISDHQKN